MIHPHKRPPHFHPDVKMGGTNTTIRAYGVEGADAHSERDASDTASEDLIIQKGSYKNNMTPFSSATNTTPQDNSDRSSVDADLERGIPPQSQGGRRRRPSEMQGGINVTTTYSVRPGSPLREDEVVPDFMRRAAVSSPPPVELDGRREDNR